MGFSLKRSGVFSQEEWGACSLPVYPARVVLKLALVLPGHYATERIGVEELAARLAEQWKDVEVWPSRNERDPVTWV